MKITGKIIALILAAAVLLSGGLYYCVRFGTRQAISQADTTTGQNSVDAGESLETAMELATAAGSEDADICEVNLNSSEFISSAVARGTDGTVKICEPGTYLISGTLENGCITVECSGKVVLMLNGASITNLTGAAISAEDADSVQVYLVEGTDNILISGTECELKAPNDDASGAALYARDDLSIAGTGSLRVCGYINNGISTTDVLTILDGSITVEAVNNGIRGKDAVNVCGGTVYVTSGNDGIKTDYEEDSVTAAESDTVTDSNAGGCIAITGGTVTVSAEDDGIHADNSLLISGGTVTVSKSNEGIEANYITITDGDISVTANDDGLNANGGNNNFGGGFFGMGGGMFGGSGSSATDSSDSTLNGTENLPTLLITGGNLYVNAAGDGLDSNGDLIIEGGYVIVDGPSNSANGALDSGTENGGSIVITGGTVLAVGDGGMAETFEDTSTQCSFLQTGLSGSAGSEIIITGADGTVLMTHTAARGFNSVVFSSPELEVGDTVTISIDGAQTTVTLDSISNGSAGGMGGFGGGGEGVGNQGGFGGKHGRGGAFGGSSEDSGSESFDGTVPPDIPDGTEMPGDMEKFDENFDPENMTMPDGSEFGGETPPEKP